MPHDETVRYKRNHFSAQFPVRYLYSPTHYWLRETSEGRWRVGLTQFATRMLGEIVEFEFETPPGNEIEPGRVLGWIEGFKAVSDIIGIAKGTFEGLHAAAQNDPERICRAPYSDGWLYEFSGSPDSCVTDVTGYVEHLDRTIDQMLDSPWKNAALDAPSAAPDGNEDS